MQLETNSLWLWGGFLVIIAFLLALDLGVFHRGNKEIKTKEAFKTILFYVFVACLFCAGLFYFVGKKAGTEFAMGYLIEMTLSVDNVFVFALVIAHFIVPKEYQYRLLYWGVLVAIILRFVFILAGTALISEFDWILYIFGAFLIFTGVKMIKSSDEEPDVENNRIISFTKKHLRTTPDYVGARFFVRENGKFFFTPLFVVLMVLNFVDIVFAFDSIPAIFAITTDPFIVFTSNIFAILGLRSMYFVLAIIIERFKYLKYGLSVILVFIGVKMVINHFYHRDIIPTDISLYVTLGILVTSVLYSLALTRGKPVEEAKATGWVPGSGSKKDEIE